MLPKERNLKEKKTLTKMIDFTATPHDISLTNMTLGYLIMSSIHHNLTNHLLYVHLPLIGIDQDAI